MNALLTRLSDTAQVSECGLTTAPVDAEGRSRFDELVTIPWSEVHRQARRIAGALQDAGLTPGDAVAVLAGAPGEIAPLVQGIWMCGASVTVVHHPTHRSDMQLWATDTENALAAVGASTVVFGNPFLSAAELFTSTGHRVLTLPDLLGGRDGTIVDSGDDAVAFLQLTSGSTGRPKAVSITYRNIDNNVRAIVSASGADPQHDVVVSWLPLFHDMGMMGCLIVPMCHGLHTVSVTPVDFLADPLVWAELLTEYRGSITAAPNFAYSVLAKRLRRAPDGAFDLSSVRFALNGAEPIALASLDGVVAEGARFGLRADAIAPAYGMAEATLAVSFVRPGEGYRVCGPPLDLAAEHRDSEKGRVALGKPLPGCEVRVVSEDGAVVTTPAIGELQIRGDAVTAGYRTEDGFESLTDTDGWLATGDIGYLTEDGQPVICGRKKDVLIISGRNVHPEDIERSVAGVQGIRPGGVAAVRLSTAAAGEGFAMVAESALHADDAETDRIRTEVADHVYQRMGVSPRTVHVVPTGWIPKTSSGKLRRLATSERLQRCEVAG